MKDKQLEMLLTHTKILDIKEHLEIRSMLLKSNLNFLLLTS